MIVKNLLAVISTGFLILALSSVSHALEQADIIEKIDSDAIEADALQYGHGKRFAELSVYGSVSSFDFENSQSQNSHDSNQGFGGGVSIVVKSLNHLLLETGLAYVQAGSKVKGLGDMQLNYLVLPLSAKFFLNPENMGFYFRSAVTAGRLLSAKRDNDLAKDFDSQIWLGAGGLFRSQMQNHVFADVVFGRSLESVFKDSRVRNEGIIFSAGLVL